MLLMKMFLSKIYFLERVDAILFLQIFCTSIDLFEIEMAVWLKRTHFLSSFNFISCKHFTALKRTAYFIEIQKTQAIVKPLRDPKYVDIYREKPVRIAVKVLVPIREHPKVNMSYLLERAIFKQ